MRRHTSLWMALLTVGISTSGALAQNGPQVAPNGGGAANVLPNQGGPQGIAQGAVQGAVQGAPAAAIGGGVQTHTTVTQTGGLLQGDIGIRFGEQFDCGHVIEMLIRKNHLARFGGGFNGPVADFGFGGPFIQPQLGDLVLESVAMISDGGPDAAPVYAVTVRNNSKFDVGCFHISAVAVLGNIHQFSPITTIRTPGKICAGDALTMEIGLPFAAMAMGNGNIRCPFDTVVVAIDAFDMLPECDEMNNILVLKRAAIAIVETAAVETPVAETAAVVEETTTTQVVPQSVQQPVVEEGEAAPAAPSPEGNSGSPLDSLDLDGLVPEADDAVFNLR